MTSKQEVVTLAPSALAVRGMSERWCPRSELGVLCSTEALRSEVVTVLAQAARLRLSGHGTGLRLRTLGRWRHDPLDDVRECCRASMALDKALGEAVHEAVATGASWRDVGQALGVSEDAKTEADVIGSLASSKQAVWKHFWP